MEEENKEELNEEESEETSPETQDESEEESEDSQDIDYKEKLEKLDNEKPRDEKEKAARALYFNYQRAKELGVDIDEVVGTKKEQRQDDPESLINRKFAERDALARSKSEDEYKLIMWYVDNRNLSVEEAHVLANKDRLLKRESEVERSNVNYSAPSMGTKAKPNKVPERSPEEKLLLERRGLRFNPKTQTYQGKFAEEYYDHEEGMWKSRKLKR